MTASLEHIQGIERELQMRFARVAPTAKGWVELARVRHAQRSWDRRHLARAAEALQEALALSPSDSSIWDMASDVYHELSRTNFTYVERAIECCRHSLQANGVDEAQTPKAASTWTNLAKVLGEAGRHREAVFATGQALRIDGSFHNRYQHAEALTGAKRRSEAQAVYRTLIVSADSRAEKEVLADVYNHLAVSMFETHIVTGGDQRPSPAHPTDAWARRDELGEALHASRAALRLKPSCSYSHAQNYYQVLATELHALGSLDLATAALWPIAATSWGGSHVSASDHMVAYARAGFRALAVDRQNAGDTRAASIALGVLEWLGHPWHEPLWSLKRAAASTRSWQTAHPQMIESVGMGMAGAESVGTRWVMSERLARDGSGLRQTARWAHRIRAAAHQRSQTPSPATLAPMPPLRSPSSSPSPSPPPSTPPSPTTPVVTDSPLPSGVIVYLCCADEAELADLRRSIRYLHRFFNGAHRYPVVVFHDMLTEEHKASLHAEAQRGAEEGTAKAPHAPTGAACDSANSSSSHHMTFERLGDDVFSMPPSMPSQRSASIPPSIRGYGMGYRHMCRFFSGPLFAHAALASYEYVWRLDSDSFLLDTPLADPFEQMVVANASYAWIHAYRDEAVFVTGLWEATQHFLKSRAIDESIIHRWVPGGARWPDEPMCFATNCFVARREWFMGEAFQAYFRALDEAGGFYAYRWGDACVHMLAVAALLPRSAILHLQTLAYWHQGTVVLPARLRSVAREILGELVLPPFADGAGT